MKIVVRGFWHSENVISDVEFKNVINIQLVSCTENNTEILDSVDNIVYTSKDVNGMMEHMLVIETETCIEGIFIDGIVKVFKKN